MPIQDEVDRNREWLGWERNEADYQPVTQQKCHMCNLEAYVLEDSDKSLLELH